MLRAQLDSHLGKMSARLTSPELSRNLIHCFYFKNLRSYLTPFEEVAGIYHKLRKSTSIHGAGRASHFVDRSSHDTTFDDQNT